MTTQNISLHEGMQAPHFSLVIGHQQTVSLEDFKGKKLLIYFYPKDDTPGCTVEACDFRDKIDLLTAKNIKVIGVSKDTVESHERFGAKYDLNFDLGFDPEMKTLQAFGVWGERHKYGKTYMGIERATFLIDENGKIIKIWRNVKAKGHVENILKTIADL